MSVRLTDAAIREAMARSGPIAAEIASQDNASTAHPYFMVYEGNPAKPSKWWRLVSVFLTRKEASAYIDGNSHRLRSPFVWVESAYDNYDFRAARQAFADVAALAAEALARGEEIARLRAALADEKRRADEAEAAIKRARDFIDERGIAGGLGGHYGLREVLKQQVARAEDAEAKVERLRAEVAAFREKAETDEAFHTLATEEAADIAACDVAAARDAALAEAQEIAERCARARASAVPACTDAGGALDALRGKESEARRIADEIAALRGKA